MIIDSGIVTGSLQVSGSFSVQGSTILTGGLNVTGGITASISGSSTNAVSASYADTALSAPYYVLTASYNADSASVSTRVSSLESWSSSLDTNFATDAQLNASASALQAGVTASISAATASLSSSLAVSIAQNTVTGSNLTTASASFSTRVTTIEDQYATTGSNIFTGTNNFDIVSASYINALSASIDYLSVIYQTSSIVFSSGSNILGDSASDTQTLWGTIDMKTGPVKVTGSLSVSVSSSAQTFFGSGSSQFGQNVTDVQTIYGTLDIKNGPVLVTGSLKVAQSVTASSLNVLFGITGDLDGTASYADTAGTASLAILALAANTASYVQQAENAYTASYVNLAQTASFVQTAQFAITASYVNLAQSASYVEYAQNAFTASYVSLAQSASYVALAVSASRAISAANADTASYVVNAISSSYAAYAVSASHAIQADLATTASYILSAVSASYAVNATNAATASSADNFTARGLVGVGGPTNAFHQLYVTTSISDGTLGLDSSGEINALYFLKGGVRGFEISTAVSSSHITQLLPYTSSGFFQIGNPSNASNDLIFLSEPVDGNVLLGPGILTGSTSLSGSQPTDRVQFTGDTFVSGALTVLNNQYIQGTVISTGGFSGSLAGNATTATTAEQAPYYVLTASYNADSSSFSTRVTNNATTASSLVNASASFSTRVTNLESFSSSLDTLFVTEVELNTATASLQAGVTASINAATASLQAGVTASITDLSSSLAPQIANLNSTASVLTSASASFVEVSSSYSTTSGSLSTRTTNLESTASTLTTASSSFSTRTTDLEATASTLTSASASFAAASGSLSTRTTDLESTTSILTTASASIATQLNTISGVTSSYAITGSNTFTGAQYISDTTNVTSFTSTAALYTDGGLRVTKDSYVSGGLWVAGDLTVYGTSSVSYVTTSVFVGLEYINLNTDLPALRYAGINVGDSGSSAGISSSFWYDSEKDNWLYVHAHAGADQTSSLAINGPITYNNLGNEQGLLANYITKAQLVDANNNHHITSSQIYDDGTTVAIAGNLQVTGSIRAASLTGSINGNNIQDLTVDNGRLTNSAITIAGTSTSLGGSITAATILSGTGVFSGSAQIPNTSITNAQLANSAVTVTAGTGLSGGGSVSLGGSVTLSNAGVTSFNTRTGGVTLASTDISGLGAGIFSGSAQIPAASITNAQLANSTISGISLGSNLAALTIGTGLSGTSYNGSTGVTIANTGVTSAVAGTGVSVSGATGAVTISIGQSVATNAAVTFDQVTTGNNGNGTNVRIGDDCWIGDVNAANTIRVKGVQDATAGYITFGNQTTALGLTNSTTLTWGAAFTATGDITAFSDARVKENVKTITGALDKVLRLRGVTYNRTDLEDKSQKIGFIAQEVQEVVPQVVLEENDRLSVAYGNLGGLFVEAFKEQQAEIEKNKAEILELRELINTLINK